MSSFHTFSLEFVRLEARQLLAGPSEEYSGMSTIEVAMSPSTAVEACPEVCSTFILDYPQSIESGFENDFTCIHYDILQPECISEENPLPFIEKEPNDNGTSHNLVTLEPITESEFNKFIQALYQKDHKSITWATWLFTAPFTSGAAGAFKNVLTSQAYLVSWMESPFLINESLLNQINQLVPEALPLLVLSLSEKFLPKGMREAFEENPEMLWSLVLPLKILGNAIDLVTASLNGANAHGKELANSDALNELAQINDQELDTTEQAALAVAKYYYAPKQVEDWTVWSKQTAIRMQGTEASLSITINTLKWAGPNGQLAALELPVHVDQGITVISNSLLVFATAITTLFKGDALVTAWNTQSIAAQYDTQESQHKGVRLDEVNSIVYRAQPSVLINSIDTLFTLARVPALGYPTAEIVYKLARSFQANPQQPAAYLPYSQAAHRVTYLFSFGWILFKIFILDPIVKFLPSLPLLQWLNINTPSTEEKQWALNTLIDGLRIDFQNSNALCKETPSKCDTETMFGPTVKYLKAFKMPIDVIKNIAKAPRTPYAKDVLTRHLNLT